MRIIEWTATPVSVNQQFLNISIRTRTQFSGQSVESDVFSLLAPNTPCESRGMSTGARAGLVCRGDAAFEWLKLLLECPAFVLCAMK